jgi:hypothetical protein
VNAGTRPQQSGLLARLPSWFPRRRRRAPRFPIRRTSRSDGRSSTAARSRIRLRRRSLAAPAV